jgi:4-phytase/acid phosphatase
MLRSSVFALMLALGAMLAPGAAQAAPILERVVVVMRHGVRPPTPATAAARKQAAAEEWPKWIVQDGDLTPHGARTVALTGRTLRSVYAARGLLPARGCAAPGAVSVWADGADERTQMTGTVLGASLEGGCAVPVAWRAGAPRDPIFGGAAGDACKVDKDHEWTPLMTPEEVRRLAAANAKLQAIIAPSACDHPAGPGVCFANSADSAGVFPNTAGFAEDILLEYAEGMPMTEVGWGRASRSDIDLIMAIHETGFARIRDNTYASARRGAAMTRVILGALEGQPVKGGPQSGPQLRLLGLAGHDTNLVLMASTFGLAWTLPGQSDSTAPAAALAFELWRDGTRRYVRAVIYYEKLDQLRDLKPVMATGLPLRFQDCANGPLGSCPLEKLEARIARLVPADCG